MHKAFRMVNKKTKQSVPFVINEDSFRGNTAKAKDVINNWSLHIGGTFNATEMCPCDSCSKCKVANICHGNYRDDWIITKDRRNVKVLL